MARYSRALRVVVNGLALVSLLLTSLPVSQVAAAPASASSTTAEDQISDLDRSPAELSLRHSSPRVSLPSVSPMDADLAGWQFDLSLASLDRPIVWDRIASQAAKRASTSRNEGASQARTFTPRAAGNAPSTKARHCWIQPGLGSRLR